MRSESSPLRFRRAVAIGFVLLAALTGCARQTLEQRAALHQKSAENWETFLESLEPYDDPALAAYVERVLARVAGERAETPAIQVTDSAYPHAYVSRRFGVRITRGMLVKLQSEAELAFVIGHELAHLDQAPREGAPETAGLSVDALAQSYARVSRQRMARELDADQRAATLLREAGYDGAAAKGALSGLRRRPRSDDDEFAMLFRTHPSGEERIAQVPPGESGDVNADRFLEALDGLPYSTPGTGLRVTDGRIVAPYIGLSFPAPAGFGPKRRDDGYVSLKSGSEKMVFAVKLFTSRPEAPEAALTGPIHKRFARSVLQHFRGDITLDALGDVRVFDLGPGIRGAAGVARLTNTAPQAEIWMALIGSKERWLTATLSYPANRRATAREIIEAFETGATPIPAAERPRLRLTRYAPGDRIERLAAGFGEGDEALARFRRVNGLPENGMPRPGQLLKTIAVY